MIDWYSHYVKRIFRVNDSIELPFVNFVAQNLEKNKRILECGSGLGRTAAALARNGYYVLAIDINKKINSLASDIHQDAVKLGRLGFVELDVYRIKNFFNRNSFDACTHAGVIEHYSQEERKKILLDQLYIAPQVFLSLPIKSDYTLNYFNKFQPVWRELKSIEEWGSEFNQYLQCVNSCVVRQRTDNAFFHLIKKDESIS